MVSMDLYTVALGRGVLEHRMVSSADLVEGQRALEISMAKIRTFFHGCLNVERPLRIEPSDLESPEDPKAVALELSRARARFAELAPGAARAYKALEEWWRVDLEAAITDLFAHEPMARTPRRDQAERNGADRSLAHPGPTPCVMRRKW